MSLEAGQTISHYRLIEKIGQGGMGVVWRAEDVRLRRTVALKTLRGALFDDETARRRFVREARAAATVNHANIATVYEIDEVAGVTFIAMEYVEGESLRAWQRDRPLNVPDALRVAGQIAKGLARAHASGVVHRDLKPENVMIGPDREAKILDFGLAKQSTNQQVFDDSEQTVTASLTQEGQIVGTVRYMSPEQALGRPVDARSDVFSFGTLLYELLTGRRPFDGRDAIETLNAIARRPAVPAGELNPDVPEELEVILGKCLAKEPERRYQDTRDLVLDLERVTGASGAGAHSYGERLPAGGAAARRRWPIVAAAAVVVIAALVAVWQLVPRGRDGDAAGAAAAPASSTRIAVLPFTVHGGDEVAYLAEGMVDLLSTALDGAGEFESADPRALLAIVRRQEPGPIDPDRAAGIAARVGAGLFVLGRVVEAGGRLNVSASIYDDRARLESSAEAAAEDEGELFGLVDDLTRQLLGELATDPTDRLVRIATTTTSDLRALKEFLAGEHKFRAGREEAAAEAFARAVEIDPEFAVAWYRLSLAAKWTNQNDLAWRAMDNARLRMGRLAESTRLRIEAFDAFLHGYAAETERRYRSILASDPDDVDSWYLLAETLFHYNPRHGRSLTESRGAFERALSLDPEHHTALHHLANVAARERATEELITLIDQVLEQYSDYWLVGELEVLRAVILEDVDAQRELMGTERVLRNGPSGVFDVAKHWNDLPGAQMLLETFARPEQPAEDRGRAFLALAVLELSQGRWGGAKRQLESSEPIDAGGATAQRALMANASWLAMNEDELMEIREAVARWQAGRHRPGQAYLLGELSARLGDREAVLQAAVELEALEPVRGLGTVFQDMALALRARVAWMEGDAAEALRLLESATMDIAIVWDTSSLYGLGEMRWLRAELLSELGREREALQWYATLTERAFGHLIYLAPSHLRRAEIYERLGQPEKAGEHYARFIELWSDCDPQLEPMMAQARKAVDALGVTR